MIRKSVQRFSEKIMRKQKPPGLCLRSFHGRNRLTAGPMSVPQNQVTCQRLPLAQLNNPGRCNDEQQARRSGCDEESLRDVHE
jgi:hypothetical protein